MSFDKPQDKLSSDELMDHVNALDTTAVDYENQKKAILEKMKANQPEDQKTIEARQVERHRQEKGLDNPEESLSFEDMMSHLSSEIIEKIGDSGEKLLEVVKEIIINVDKLGTQLATILVMFDGDGSNYYQQQSAELSKQLNAELTKLRKEDISAADIKKARVKSQEIHNKYLELVQRAFLELKNRKDK